MSSPIERRDFLKLAGAAVATTRTQTLAPSPQRVWIVVDPADAVAASPPAQWAIRQLRRALSDRHATAEVAATLPHTTDAGRILILGGPSLAPPGLKLAKLTQPESLRITPHRVGPRPDLYVAGADPRGLVYAILDLADRIRTSTDQTLGLTFANTLEEAPANRVRSCARAFCSELEDKPWFYDKSFWTGYLDALAANRFNRFNLAFGFGYDFPRGVTDDYFHFPYPYLIDVPGYNVRPVPLADGERARNYEAFRYIAKETAARGLQFQLGIWTHAYQWTDSPNATHHFEGLTPENHAPYCRDALAIILRDCPEITGVTMRVHGESGIPEGSYPFWQTLFKAIAKCGRPVEIDMHAKGINQIMIDMAVATGMKVKVSAKYSAEHMSLGYHQADIRELEIPRPETNETGIFSVSNGDRRFTRYGYADLYQQDRKFDVLYRLWPGTQRHLVWGDPETAAAYARTAHFCDASGLELCEPLTFKGREGSGLPGNRTAYAETSLTPTQDWQKFAYTYRLWGRLLYNPDCEPEVWRRWTTQRFASNASFAEVALTHASRILPLVTTAHMVSASNHSYWPEIYENMPTVLGAETSPYSDTPTPRCFATVSPLDPQLFSTIAEYADDLLQGRPSPKYSPIDVATWLEDLAAAAAGANDKITGSPSSELARWQEDIRIQVALAAFFVGRIRGSLAWEIFQRTHAPTAAQQAIRLYTGARDQWATMAQRAKAIYVADITYGSTRGRRGDWADRLPAIDRDIAAMRAASAVAAPPVDNPSFAAALKMVTTMTMRTASPAKHLPPASFQPGQPLALHLDAGSPAATATLAYRHVNQGERWQTTPMTHEPTGYHASIPAEYTRSPYPLQYYFIVSPDSPSPTLFPGFNATLSNQPYYAIWRRHP